MASGVGMAEVVGPSTGLLTTDDVILSVDGVEVRVAMDLVHAIGGRAPGDLAGTADECDVRSTAPRAVLGCGREAYPRCSVFFDGRPSLSILQY